MELAIINSSGAIIESSAGVIWYRKAPTILLKAQTALLETQMAVLRVQTAMSKALMVLSIIKSYGALSKALTAFFFPPGTDGGIKGSNGVIHYQKLRRRHRKL